MAFDYNILSKTLSESSYTRHSSNKFYIKKIFKLIKINIIFCIIPILILFILFLQNKLSFSDSILYSSILFITSFLISASFLKDLLNLTHYVREISLDKKINIPPLTYLSNIEELSYAVKSLNINWNRRKVELETALAEITILFDLLPDMLIIVDDHLNIIKSNNSANLIIGKKLRHKNIDNIFKDADFSIAVKRVLNTSIATRMDLDKKFNGESYSFRVVITKFPIYSQKNIAALITLHDITSLKNAKQTMKDFVANAGHEIRTPLTSIIGFIEMLQTVAKDDPKAQKEFLAIIENQARHLSLLVNDLLTLSTAEIKENIHITETLDIIEHLESSIKSVKWQLSGKKMNIIYHPDEKLPLIAGESSQITQILNNLLTNAIKYGEENSNIEVTTGKIDNYIYVSIKNYGEGISKKDISKLTRRFFRAAGIRSKNIQGAGLGLAIVKHLLTRHQGKLEVESKLGKWSKFIIYLPTLELYKTDKVRSNLTID